VNKADAQKKANELNQKEGISEVAQQGVEEGFKEAEYTGLTALYVFRISWH